MFSKFAASLAVLAVIAVGPAAAAPTPSRSAAFARDYGAFIDRLRATPYAPPGFIVVAVHENTTVFEMAYGTRNASTGAPMTLDTPIYHASLTKAYTGILAALLHRDGTLPLQTTLTDVWPGLTLPQPLDPAQVSMAQLLSHSSGMMDGGLQFQSNVTGEVDRAGIPAHISQYATSVPSFQYSNFGPFLYSAIAEERTGETWHQAIRRRVLEPLGLTRTSTRQEDFPANEVAQCHVIRGGRWTAIPPKPTALLNAAGGMYATARDTARFMKVFTTGGRSAGGRIPAEVLAHTWQAQSVQDVNFAGLQRDGYGLGWDLGSYDGHRYVSRSGGYYGCRSYALWIPELKFGVAILSVGDTAVNTANVTMIKQDVDLWTGNSQAGTRGEERIASYHNVIATEAAKLQTIDPRLARPASLDRRVAQRATGTYRNARLGRALIARTSRGLSFQAGALRGDLVPVGGNSFLLLDHASLDVTSFQFIGDARAGFDAFILDDDRYERARR